MVRVGRQEYGLRGKGPARGFVPGEKDSRGGGVKPGTAKNVRWARKLCQAIHSTPVVAGGRIFVGGRQGDLGLLMCLDEPTGKLLWQWQGPSKEVPYKIDGWIIGISINPCELGVCSSPVVEGDRVYFVTHSFQVLCLDVKGQPAGSEAGKARVLWSYDLWEKSGVFPCDAANGSPLIDGDLLYVTTSNGIDHNMDPYAEKNRKLPAPACAEPHRLGEAHGTPRGHRRYGDRGPHAARTVVFALAGQRRTAGSWSSSAAATVCATPSRPCHSVPNEPLKLKTVWSYDCNPPEYKSFGKLDWVTHYCMGDNEPTTA